MTRELNGVEHRGWVVGRRTEEVWSHPAAQIRWSFHTRPNGYEQYWRSEKLCNGHHLAPTRVEQTAALRAHDNLSHSPLSYSPLLRFMAIMAAVRAVRERTRITRFHTMNLRPGMVVVGLSFPVSSLCHRTARTFWFCRQAKARTGKQIAQESERNRHVRPE